MREKGEGTDIEHSDDVDSGDEIVISVGVRGGSSRASTSESSDEEETPLAGLDYFYPESWPMANHPNAPRKKNKRKRTEEGVDEEATVERSGHGGWAWARAWTWTWKWSWAWSYKHGGWIEDNDGERQPLVFLQTYGNNGEIIPLPLYTPAPEGTNSIMPSLITHLYYGPPSGLSTLFLIGLYLFLASTCSRAVGVSTCRKEAGAPGRSSEMQGPEDRRTVRLGYSTKAARRSDAAGARAWKAWEDEAHSQDSK
ncbi:hypothetical protein B0H17DRAFT_1212086 [Mycena rosella]|uniref:Uncharacterized protein n=1 Tax=Mycena rosella TaxID=1033263 RepID=A0AAD7CSJ7_MYCRO|nr:hypothetical protein B0H17DRAFT_1212086 [Mycena rosella]